MKCVHSGEIFKITATPLFGNYLYTATSEQGGYTSEVEETDFAFFIKELEGTEEVDLIKI